VTDIDNDVELGSDPELLAYATSILTEEGYAVEGVQSGPLTLVLAENAYFLVAIVATPTIGQLMTAESFAEAALADRLSNAEIGAKKWDAYLVLLTQELSPETEAITRGLFEINYDTSRLRRLAHAGVDPSLDSVRAALAPFVPPIELDDPAITDNPFQTLINALASNGVDRAMAQRAVDAFEQGVPLANVL